jgi:universal stress protein A
VEDAIMLPVKTILHATDFSPYSDLAFRLSCSLARDYRARLVVLHVMEPPLVIYDSGSLLTSASDSSRATEREKLQSVQAPSADVIVEHRLVEGDAAAEILRAAAEIHADLIVLGTHGRTGVRRLLMGSVAEQVVRRAPCPVLTAKPSESAERHPGGAGSSTASQVVAAGK